MLMLPSCFEHLNGRISALLGDLSDGVYIAQFLAIEVLIDLRVVALDDTGAMGKIGRLTAVVGLATVLAFLIESMVQSRIDQ
jgi:peptidoglycan/LPS O-acetylase OafA/YrhL